MKKAALSLAIALAMASISGCQFTSDAQQAQIEAEQKSPFVQLTDKFIESLWYVEPTWALYEGYHKYDTKLVIPNEEHRALQGKFIEAMRERLLMFDTTTLTASQKIDFKLMHNIVEKMDWELNEFKSWQWNPANYNVAGGFAQIINGTYAPLDDRLRVVLERMKDVPAYYTASRLNVVNPTLEHTLLAIQQNEGANSVFSKELLEKAMASNLTDEEKKLFQQRYKAAKLAVRIHIGWLKLVENSIKGSGPRDFRIGEAQYEKKFALDIQSGMTAKQLYEKAVADKTLIQAEMEKLTQQLWPKYFTTAMPKDSKQATRQLIDKLSANHVEREKFVTEINAQIPELVEFVKQKDLITLDPDKPLVVRETPEYMRGFAGASISAPGPYDKAANTYYNVTPLDDMSAEGAESYLREYNHWILQILNIHEAIPGHYTQLVYSNESPSIVKSLFGNGAMVEGWAVYTERMMLEEGYGNFEPEMWLMYYKWNLRVICNTILDYSVQVKGMDKDAAIKLLTEEAFQQQAEAEGKWKRATLSQVQLTSYYAGYREIYDLREEVKQARGDKFNLKAFHEEFLSYGSAPVKYIREMMLAK
ncbi:DUF885 domain-containing protein [Shewanella marina]|uniref:DUF885 domain-containing protein n=1 Tax=Shewanella marina TaxID=487319 RepID=UPI000470FE73|nr:DUF885 domain-containing protein [Shewanella marina]